MQRVGAIIRLALVAAFAAVLAGCGSTGGTAGSGTPSKSIFAKPDWASFTGPAEKNLDLARTVAPEDLVDGAGYCAAASAADSSPAPAIEPGNPAVVPVANAGTQGAGAPSVSPNEIPLGGGAGPGTGFGPAVVGGVALGMTECQVVRRAGQPGNVNIGANEAGERSAVLTYLTGSWPGIYHFASGRLKEIVRAPEPPAPPKAPPRKRQRAKPKAAQANQR